MLASTKIPGRHLDSDAGPHVRDMDVAHLAAARPRSDAVWLVRRTRVRSAVASSVPHDASIRSSDACVCAAIILDAGERSLSWRSRS